MDPVNEHDPTMDAHIVHAVNVNNKKEVANMRFLTKSLANARQVQESIYRQEEKDLIRQLWKLHKEKECRHPELDYSRRSGYGLQRHSSDEIEISHSRRGSYDVLHHPKGHHNPRHTPPLAHQQRVHDDKYSYTGLTGEIYHPTTSQHYYPSTVGRDSHYYKDNGSNNRRIPFSVTSSHHFNPALVEHHHHPEYYPQAHHRGHAAGGYQPSEHIPGNVLQSSRLNAIVQPAGYGHSISEHAAHLGMHKHYHRGVPYHANRRSSHTHPFPLTDDNHNIGSYESLTRYITLLDYQASEEGKTAKHPKGPHHHRQNQHQSKLRDAESDKQGDKPHPGDIGDDETPGKEKTGKEVIETAERASPVWKKQNVMIEPNRGTQRSEELICQDYEENKTTWAKPKSIGFVGVPSATPSPNTASPTKTTTDDGRAVHRQLQPPDKTHSEAGKHSNSRLRSVEKVAASKGPITKLPGKETAGVGVEAAKKCNRRGLHKSTTGIGNQGSHGEVLPQSSSHHYQYISQHPSYYATIRTQHPLTKQVLSDLHAIATHPSHHSHSQHSNHYHHPSVAYRPKRQGPVTTAERKRLAVELLAREYPVLLRHAPTKFDPLDALMCRYLRLSSTNIETLEAMCKEAGIEVGAHPHRQIDNVNEYVFGSEK